MNLLKQSSNIIFILVFLFLLPAGRPVFAGSAAQDVVETPTVTVETGTPPAADPTAAPTQEPSAAPTQAVPTDQPTAEPTMPTSAATPTADPTGTPSPTPTITGTPANQSEIDALLAPLTANDWPQVQKDARRSGFTNENIGLRTTVIWRKAFQPEKVYPQVQAIVASGKVFVGTESGNLYALAADSGAQAWKFTAGGPILNSVATDGSLVFFGSMDGAVYGINIDTGAQVWRTKLSRRTGFSTAPVIADGYLMLGGRDGVFYALNPANGQVAWQTRIGSPILQTAAAANGRVYFGAMNMRVYALNTNGGSQAWASNPIPAKAFKDYWPVVHNGHVIITAVPSQSYAGITPGFPYLWFSEPNQWSWLAANSQRVAQGSLTSVADAMNAQNSAVTNFYNNPQSYARSLFILNESNGQESFGVPHWATQTMNGATTPPCIDSGGNLIIPVLFVRSGWGRLNLSSQRVTDILYDGRDRNGNPVDAQHSTPAGFGNGDENLNVTCTGNQVLSMHNQEENANYTGIFDFGQRRWSLINPGAWNKQMSNNTQGGGGNPASVSNGRIFHISYYELVVRTTQP